MGVLRRYFECDNVKCKNKWSSIAYQMDEQQCPECKKICHFVKTKQKKKNGFLIGTYVCKGRKGKKCGREWKSAVAFKGSWQMCTRCQTRCHPDHVFEHDYEDVTTVASISSEIASVNIDDNNNERTSKAGGSSVANQEASPSTQNMPATSETTGNKEEDESHLPKRQVQNDRGHIMANCGECIFLGQCCVKYYEFIRNPEKEKAAKKKADKLRPMLKIKMYEEQNIHIALVKNMMGGDEQKAMLQKIDEEGLPSSGPEDENPPPQPPAHKRRYRKRKSKKPKKQE
ncbi:Oidioi.mRNA.OKI2018_I69.chr1.g2382.t1.cds [Oikopleura dioica]|uniref:Oidioi.mRNA.OKI2018_I69.chr1.g2382.t1.cds n=1 Tax=Oikopleura dioica TaxID=34765 RepID=A0ABN7SV58_OIKDI|nr:Oidioi.mRNA.OKI2018_I69.chr1.g2382.t1.cds [Oikopleura dioica]